jgi:hypothetical protein
MTQKNFMFKTTIFAFLAATALWFTACGDNPIEIENENVYHFSDSKIQSSLDKITSNRQRVDLYRCTQSNISINDKKKREQRCSTFIEKYGEDTDLATIIKMVSDTVSYSDNGNYTRTNNSDSPIISDDSSKFYYLTQNKTLNITLTRYKQIKDNISSTKKIGNPEIRFQVKTFIDGDSSGYEPLSAYILDTLNVKDWKGSKTGTVLIPRGIDELEICPIVIDNNELDDHYENETLLEDECISIKEIGYIEDKKTTEQSTSNDRVYLEWRWNLFEAE